VKLLVDAQLPVRLAEMMASLGHDVVHTTALVDGNRTSDAEIIRAADAEERVVVTKDRDFLDGHLLNEAPQRLLLVTTGNIRNDDLLTLVRKVEPLIVEAFDHSVLVEVSREAVISH